MSILVNKNSKVVVQGITGSDGSFHAKQMLEYGTNIVAGVTPGKGGQTALEGKVPVYNSVEEAKLEAGANISIIFVPLLQKTILANAEPVALITISAEEKINISR